MIEKQPVAREPLRPLTRRLEPVRKSLNGQRTRGTWARATRRGREVRAEAIRILAELASHDRPAGPVHGARGYAPYFSRHD